MPKFSNGTYVNKTGNGKAPYLRISAGPHRDRYVHEMVMEAKLGRELLPGETVEHDNADGLDCDWRNLRVVTQGENVTMANERRRKSGGYRRMKAKQAGVEDRVCPEEFDDA